MRLAAEYLFLRVERRRVHELGLLTRSPGPSAALYRNAEYSNHHHLVCYPPWG